MSGSAPTSLLLLLAAASPSWAASRFCAEVSVDGRPLPLGLLSVSPGRELVRLRDGRACVELEPGVYTVSAAAGSSQAPLALRREGSSRPSLGQPLTIGKDQRIDWRLAYADPEPTPKSVDAKLLFPEEEKADLASEPALLVLTYERADGPPREVCLWARGKAEAGELRLKARVPDGRLTAAVLLSRRWAVVDSSFEPGLALRLEPSAGRLRGTVRLPGGAPLRPVFSKDGSAVGVVNLLIHKGPYFIEAAVARDGTFEFPAVARGWHPLFAIYRRSGPRASGLPDWSVPPGRWVLMKKDAQVDLTLAPWSKLRLAGPDLPPSGQHVVMGVPAGGPMPEQAAALYGPGAPVTLLQSPSGAWAARFNNETLPDEPAAFRVSTGAFDFYLLRKGVEPRPFVHLLRPPVALRLTDGGAVDLRLPGPYDEGACALEGSLIASIPVDGSLREREPGLADPRIVPRVDLYRGERWVATAFGSMPSAVERARLRGEDGALARLLAGARWEFGASGLPAGRYRVVASAFGHRDRATELDLTAGKTARLDLDLDAR